MRLLGSRVMTSTATVAHDLVRWIEDQLDIKSRGCGGDTSIISIPHSTAILAYLHFMAFKLHGGSTTTCTRRVALIAKERNLKYELIPIDFNVAEHKQPPHLKHQPFGQIPYITVRYLSFLYPMHSPLMHNFLRNLAS